MSRRFSKGKGKRLASPSHSSENDDATDGQHIPSKRLRQSSTERVHASAIAKMAPTASSSSSKGLAGFSALIANRATMSTATSETNHGLKGGRSGRLVSRASSQSKAAVKATEVEGMTVGTIVFIVVGIMENQIDDLTDTSQFHPVYCLRSDVDISPMALTGMRQAGLCIMKDTGFDFLSTDTYGMIDFKLQALFPKLYEWLVEDDPAGQATSWLICVKPPHKKSLIVYTDDSEVPNGFDIMRACTMARSKAGIQDRILYLATRNPVPAEIVQGWRPKVSSSRIVRSHRDQHGSEDEDIDTSSDDPPSPSSLLFHDQQAQLRRSSRLKNKTEESEVETEVISISDESDGEDAASGDRPTDPDHPADLSSDADDFNKTFASIDFTGQDNPWN